MMLALKLLGGNIFGWLKGLPWQAWAGLACAALVLWHLHGDKGRIRAADRAGYTRAMDEVAAKSALIEKRAREITAAIRSRNDEESRRIASAADDLRVRGPGKARCSSPAIPAGPGGRVPPSGIADAPSVGVPDSDWIALPFDFAIRQAEVCDLNRAEVLSWREWHKSQ